MARSDEQNRLARERARENILHAAIETFSERGVAGASVADITRRAGVAQGLVSYHFGGKEQLIVAVIDQWFAALFGLPEVQGSADTRLAGIIDGAILSTGYALPLQKVVLALQQQPATHRLYAQSEDRFHERAIQSEESVRDVFRERGAVDPELEEIMLRSTLEGILLKFSVYGDTFPLEDARRWMYRLYDLPEPDAALPLEAPAREVPVRLRASGAVRGQVD
ncbi:HTH-type transcriptional repressor Rv3405c [Microbacterium oxydans]|uniref:HTH-type transcriptional regulator BetI n=1 Tax=Microbacterium oxydans TaxID=82380 RepID=A0A0F0LLP5_9MICO|nr:TetR/AcrR family transcriptional regulator [Microbacterium oxydans]KJL32451.1 HTH-type transcriptional regulator BetI [Microbacterium oxydans]CAH0227244.1 HTH-type transcriptional repressor Rv3405c [Microbacterium oxydans]